MRRTILLLIAAFAPMSFFAQDFVNRFLEHRDPDVNLKCVSVSPKMIREVIEMGEEMDNKDLFGMIAELKSMQVVTSEIEGKVYYDEAVAILNKNTERFEPLGTYNDGAEIYRILVRRMKGQIVELVMLVNAGKRFAIVDFTGNISNEFIDRIAASVKTMRSR